MNQCSDSVIINNIKLEICIGDLTEEHVDAIVNAANAYLQHGGGVAGAIVRKGGSIIQHESDEWIRLHQRVQHATPALTGAGNLPAKYIIHAVGPIWGEGEEDRKLMEAVKGALDLADSLHLESISFPAISTGIYGFPKERAARIIIYTIKQWMEHKSDPSIQLIRIILINENYYKLFVSELGSNS